MKLNLGCRLDIRNGYENIDLVPVDPRVVQADVRKLPYPSESIEEIIAQDVLEHIYPWEAAPAIRHWFGLLIPHGKLHVRVPDIIKQCQLVASGAWDARTFTYMVYGGVNLGEHHFTGFTMDRLTGMLEGAGFVIEHTDYEHRNAQIDPTLSNNVNILVDAIKP